MILQDIYGFPVTKNEKDGSIEIDNNCEYPQQSEDCENLYQSIEWVIIEEEELNFPLHLKEWNVTLEPTEKNIKQYYSLEGIVLYLQQFKTKLIDTTTFFKLEVYYPNDESLPSLILHFFEVNYEDTLNIIDNYGFSDRCFVKYNTNQLTPNRITNLGDNNINYKWIRHIPMFPIEVIKFDNDRNIKKFKHQELNRTSFTDEV